VNQWFETYLRNRKQYVEIKYMENTSRTFKKVASTLKETKGAVPQGSFLGPGLFLLYTWWVGSKEALNNRYMFCNIKTIIMTIVYIYIYVAKWDFIIRTSMVWTVSERGSTR
jgi:hypothetical protein